MPWIYTCQMPSGEIISPPFVLQNIDNGSTRTPLAPENNFCLLSASTSVQFRTSNTKYKISSKNTKFNLLHLISLATATGSLASAATIINILNYSGNAFNIDPDAGATDYSPVNAYLLIASTTNEKWIIVPGLRAAPVTGTAVQWISQISDGTGRPTVRP
ncbi:hypothetical protein DFH08DRAFT_962880 [Mycena albidolilacea]|uniref:Uncharacterized protein n=1 Tax=Mycena albidolilacea TaxID=1033008 RepID=A0AAD6ZW96_9AGAR|nr:hypothetical protein DFH08DRAFT_962880 [Mycena albidolilacea]